MDQRPKPFTPPEPQPVDHVEKSLRDINLRLKNAERDQENARKQIKDVVSTPQNSQRRPDQNNNRPNRGRDDDFRRRDRDRHNRPQGNQLETETGPRKWTGRHRPIYPGHEPATRGDCAGALFSSAEIAPPRPQIIAPSQPVAAKEPVAIVPENTEVLHGRKCWCAGESLPPKSRPLRVRPTPIRRVNRP